MRIRSMFKNILIISLLFSVQTLSAQIKINVPKIPKVNKEKTEELKSDSTKKGQNNQPEDVQINPDAPPDYDAGLKVNDKAIAVGRLRNIDPVKILAKSGNTYKVEGLEHPNHVYWYSANSVYPYFDKSKFVDLKWGNHRYITPYLECYAKKHNLEIDKVNNGGEWVPRFNDYKEMRKALEEQLPKLAEVANNLKSLQSRPNTFLGYDTNPAIWEEISNNREEYLKCAVSVKESAYASESLWLKAHLEDIENRQKEVDEFTPSRGWLVSSANTNHLLIAVSPSARADYLSNAQDFKSYLEPALDKLNSSAAKKLPLYLPNTKAYSVHNIAEEKLMRGNINELTSHKIHYIGLQQANWIIDKNSLGIPKNRYKHGMVWVRYTPNDHPYCRVYYINIIQDYAGGGTYGASYAYFAKDELFGCPAK